VPCKVVDGLGEAETPVPDASLKARNLKGRGEAKTPVPFASFCFKV